LNANRQLSHVIAAHQAALLEEWIPQQIQVVSRRGRISEAELREQSRAFIDLLRTALDRTTGESTEGPDWEAVRNHLAGISRSRTLQGFNPVEVATFVFSLKKPLFDRLRAERGKDAQALGEDVWAATRLLDELGLYTTEIHQRAREEVIERQKIEMLELSTPVVTLWEGILALPLIGTLDSERTQTAMENLLTRIAETGSELVILDITGVPTVDTLVAQHLMRTVTAARLMGADAVISGVRPQIAQTIVHLGIQMGDITTRATLADAFQLALRRRGIVLDGTARS